MTGLVKLNACQLLIDNYDLKCRKELMEVAQKY